MEKSNKKKPSGSVIVFEFILLVILVIVFSSLSVKMWGSKLEAIPEFQKLTFNNNVTVAEFAKHNNIPNSILKEAFNLHSKPDLQKPLKELDLSHDEISTKIEQSLALGAEEESKDWRKILIKFVLWILFLIVVFVLMKRTKITPKTRKGLYLSALIIFGIILGADPSPMGTVKDAIVLFADKGVIFMPRMLALLIFLTMIFIANKFICSWGCQFGTLQDVIFRLNRNNKDTKGIFRQYKP